MSHQTILRLPSVAQRTGSSCSIIYSLIKDGQFKPPINLGARAVGWLESDVSGFIGAHVKASRKA
ncbi:helix-turn-helix transcriptional regulator [Undibacterium umbellatum]|uniref:AlpA family phage regulatory protein n=1 Tax=Undibacterium umbellatum TaxID=2762300 RepID=A0ABR6ZB92_9BURK|nr:AlpA family phage regulatory protein [Undibacterium umbellatum]MBC3909030.1 AlpA family phage regulatory protein [Undibacterium umbellatum]